MELDRIIVGDVLAEMGKLPAGSVHCAITSPPYWGLRDYGTAEWEGGDPECDHRSPDEAGKTQKPTKGQREHAGRFTGPTCWKCGARRIDSQLGLEKTPQEYIEKMVAVFREVKRVLRDDGTLWLNMGDSYAHNGPCGGSSPDGDRAYRATDRQKQEKMKYQVPPGLKPKDLCGIPWRLALALQQPYLKCKGCGHVAHQLKWGRFPNGRLICPACEKSKGHTVDEPGWYLRADIIWKKPNPMPESCTDRPTKSHEYLFLLTKRARYFYDGEAIKESLATDPSSWGRHGDKKDPGAQAVKPRPIWRPGRDGTDWGNGTTRNRRSVWTIPTQPYPEAHFATFPEALVLPCIKAGTSERGCCPECGKPWERIVEKERRFESGSGRSGKMPVGKHGADLQGGGETLDVRRGPCVGSRTIGWRPGCECYGAEIIADQPAKGSEETKAHHEARLAAWRELWDTLAPQYQRLPTVPCTVLDPFSGSGTTCMVAAQLGRSYIGIELNPDYAKMSEERIAVALNPTTYTKADIPDAAPLFAETTKC